MRTRHLALLGFVGGLVLACKSSSTVNSDDAPADGGEVAGAVSATGGATGETGGTGAGTGGGTPASGGAAGAEAGDAGSDSGGSPTTTGGAPAGGAPAGGTAATAGEGGVVTTSGGTATGGSAGSPGGGSATGGLATAGTAGSVASTGGAASGGAAGALATAGASTGGTAGTGGAGETGGAAGAAGGDDTVRGRVIDFWGHPIPNVPVEIGGEVTLTDADGGFTVADVAAEYDASLVVDYLAPTRRIYGWVYQGLTRRDPTLQVYTGLPLRDTYFAASFTTVPFEADWNLDLSFGGRDGTSIYEDVGENGIGQTTIEWRGADTTTSTAHGLLWQNDSATGLPTAYLAYDSVGVALTEASSAEVSLDLTAEAIVSGNLRGEVLGGAGDRYNAAFVRFTTGAAIEVVHEYEPSSPFSYLVPSLPSSSLTFVAAAGSAYQPPFALAHVDGLAAGQDIEVTIPAPSTLLLPAADAIDVNQETPFQFLASPDSGGAVVVYIKRVDYFDGLFVVTAREELTIPEVVGGAFSLQPGSPYFWWVETHGDQATVDELAGADGFLDAFSLDTSYPLGPRRGSGAYTVSAARNFTTAP